LQALQLLDTTHTTIDLQYAPIQSAVHVTGCHHLTLLCLESQQVRLHESTHLTIHIHNCSASAILEDCSDILFVVTQQQQQQQQTFEAKDFNWLRMGIPSPNFRIEQATYQNEHDVEGQPPASSILSGEKAADVPGITNTTTDEAATNEVVLSGEPVHQEDDEDDDEL
jgi:hypothetical protein